jgi:hypothetical protein
VSGPATYLRCQKGVPFPGQGRPPGPPGTASALGRVVHCCLEQVHFRVVCKGCLIPGGSSCNPLDLINRKSYGNTTLWRLT